MKHSDYNRYMEMFRMILNTELIQAISAHGDVRYRWNDATAPTVTNCNPDYKCSEFLVREVWFADELYVKLNVWYIDTLLTLSLEDIRVEDIGGIIEAIPETGEGEDRVEDVHPDSWEDRFKVFRDGYCWHILNKKEAEACFKDGIFELFRVYNNGSSGLIESEEELHEAWEKGIPVGIELGYLPERIEDLFTL